MEIGDLQKKRPKSKPHSVASTEPTGHVDVKPSKPKDTLASKQKEAQPDILVLDPERVAKHPEFQKTLVRLAREQGLEKTVRFSEVYLLDSFDSEITRLARGIVKQNKKTLEKTDWTSTVSSLNVFAQAKSAKERKLIETGIIQKALQEAARAITKEKTPSSRPEVAWPAEAESGFARALKDALNTVDADVPPNGVERGKKKKAFAEILGLLTKEQAKEAVPNEKALEEWLHRTLATDVYGGDASKVYKAIYAIKEVVKDNPKEKYPEVVRTWAGIADTGASAETETELNDVKDAVEGENKRIETDIDAFIDDLKNGKIQGLDKSTIKVELTAEQEKELKEIIDALIVNPENEDVRRRLGAFDLRVQNVVLDFAMKHFSRLAEMLQETIAVLQSRVDVLEKDNADFAERFKVMEAKVAELSEKTSPASEQQAPQQPQGVPPQVQRPVGFDMPGQTGQVNYNYNYPPQGAPWPPQYQQYQAPPTGQTFGGNPNAPKPEPAAAQGSANPETKPEDTTKPEANENTKNPAQQAAEDMRAAMEGKIPSSIESLLMQKRGETPMWKRVRNAVGLMVIGGAAGATVVSLGGLPAMVTALIGGSKIAAGALTGAAAAGISGAVRGGIEARSAINYAKESAPNKYVSWNEIFTHVFRKSLVGAGFGAVGGGIGAGVMDAYGDQIRAGAGALGDWANKEVTDLKEGLGGAKEWLLGLFGTETLPPMPGGGSAVPTCAANEATLAAMDAKLSALSDRFDIREGITRIKLNTLAGLIDQQNVTLDAIKESLNGAQTQNADLNNFVAQLSAEPKAGLTKLFNEYGNTAYYFFQNNIILPDAAPVAESVPTSSVPEVTPGPDTSPAADVAASAATEAVNRIDQDIIGSFHQAVTNGGVWTGTGNVLEAAGITPEMGSIGGKDVLSYLTDVFEDYTQDGTAPGTKATSYFRTLGEGLLDKISNQTGATQITLKGDLNMEHLFGNEEIQKDALRRIADNLGSTTPPDLKAKIVPLIEKIFANAKVALSK